jgi:hypothetical protein
VQEYFSLKMAAMTDRVRTVKGEDIMERNGSNEDVAAKGNDKTDKESTSTDAVKTVKKRTKVTKAPVTES